MIQENFQYLEKFPEKPLSHAPKLQNLEKVSGISPESLPVFGNSFRDLPIWGIIYLTQL